VKKLIVAVLASLILTAWFRHGAYVPVCTAGAFNLSLTTGCNIPFYVGGIFP
jgi:hypothetical protein